MANKPIKKRPHLVSSNSDISIALTPPHITTPPIVASAPENHTLDHILHAAVAKVTGNLSPASLGLARHDWAVHLAFSPDKLIALQKSLVEKVAQLGWYGMQVAAGKKIEPLILPSPGDKRFRSDGWQEWPFNVLYQGFLLYEDWWKEATTDVRGASPHNLDVVSFTARQWVDAFSPSNALLSNPDAVAATMSKGGANLLQGSLNFMDDQWRKATGKPPAGTEAFKVCENVANQR